MTGTTTSESTLTEPNVEAAIAQYGGKAVAVEPGGVDYIPAEARHGKPRQLFWTWMSPNLEFATVGVGVLGCLFWGLSFWQCVAAIVVGSGLGALSQGLLSSWGPQAGLPQMVLSRLPFGFRGNILPAGLNALLAGIGWFAVNSISGALALHALVPAIPSELCLVLVVAVMMALAVFGHNLVQAFEKYAFPVLAAVFLIGLFFVFSKGHLSAPGTGGTPPVGAFLLMVGASFGYAAGWNPYGTDYTRYLPETTSKVRVGFAAGLGIFVSCVLLESAGAAMVTAAGQSAAVDPGIYTGLMPTWLGKLTLLAITIGAICANAINVYSGSMSFMALGIALRSVRARAIVAAIFATIGFIVASFGLANAGRAFEAFLLVIAYWIGPWLGVVLTDRLIFGRRRDELTLTADTTWRNWAGPIAMLTAMVVSILTLSNQQKFVGFIARSNPNLGDITFFAGFLIAAGVYALLVRLMPPRSALVKR